MKSKFIRYIATLVTIFVLGLPAYANFGTAYITSADGAGAGLWHVTVSSVGATNVWNVNAWAFASTDVPLGNVPGDNVHAITISFFDNSIGASKYVQSPGPSLGIVSSATNGYTYSNIPAEAGSWVKTATLGGVTFETEKLLPNNLYNPITLQPDGTNKFFGTITLSDSTNVKYIRARLEDGVAWNGYAAVTPESSSLAMLLPGILPLGLVLNRRRKA